MFNKVFMKKALEDSPVLELRHQLPGGRKWTSTWVANMAEAENAIDAQSTVGNLFCTINRIEVAPQPKLIKPGTLRDPAVWRDSPAGNADVSAHCRLLFDFDPQRPPDTSSTDAELAMAVERAAACKDFLTGHRWPAPAMAISGNGAHLVYRVNLRNNQATHKLLARLYDELALRFGDDAVEFDRTVKNPGRIGPVYGTIKRKGVCAPDRPHRQSEIDIPSRWDKVSAAKILAVAGEEKPREVINQPRPKTSTGAPGRGNYHTLDIVAWFAAHGHYLMQLTERKHAVRCPWEEGHSKRTSASSTVIWPLLGGEPPNFWPKFSCAHAHCYGRRTMEVMAHWGDADNFCSNAY